MLIFRGILKLTIHYPGSSEWPLKGCFLRELFQGCFIPEHPCMTVINVGHDWKKLTTTIFSFEKLVVSWGWYPSCLTPKEPFKEYYVPNKYSLYKVQMGLFIKSTIPRVPPFSLMICLVFLPKELKEFSACDQITDLTWRQPRKTPGRHWKSIPTLGLNWWYNVGKYSIHGSYGTCTDVKKRFPTLDAFDEIWCFSFILNSWHFAPNPKQRCEWTTKSVIPLYRTCQRHFILYTKTCKTRLTWKLEKSSFMKKQPSLLASSLFVFGECIDLVKFAFWSRNKDTI